MKMVIANLSDIHFNGASTNPISRRVAEIASAIASTEVQPSTIVLTFSGDITDKGRGNEYDEAITFINDLKQKLSDRFPSIPVHVLAIPGNHDLEHQDNSESFRKNAVDGSQESMLHPAENEFYLKQLLEPQNKYFAFRNWLDYPPLTTKEKICNGCSIEVEGKKVRFNLINTALLSQIHESQGGLRLPLPLLEEAMEPSAPFLTITLMHHPIYWIESQNLTELRDLLGQTSDYLITGHEHFSTGYEVKSELGNNLRYYESPALFDPTRPLSSAFRVLVFDLDEFREKQFVFEWDRKDAIYRQKRSSVFDWRTLSTARIERKSFRLNSSAINFFLDPGFASPRHAIRTTTLRELFVYPDLKIRKGLSPNEVELKKSHELLSFLIGGGIKEIHGAPLSGKTTISKALVLDLRLRGLSTPIWIDGKRLGCASVQEFENAIEQSFKEHYASEQLDSYLQLSPEQRCVIIDDWHLAAIPTSTRAEILKWVEDFAAASILFSDEAFRIRELLAKGQLRHVLHGADDAEIAHMEIASLSHVSQASLIHKYLKITKEKLEHPEESSESRKREELVSELLGRDRLPAYPFFVLCILEAIEMNRTSAISGGSHGPLYELLIYSAIGKENPEDPDFANKLVFLQEIAFSMWSNRMTSMSLSGIRDAMATFTQTSYLTLPVDDYLKALLKAKILSSTDGNFRFTYSHYFYYFIARYFREHLDEKGSEGLYDSINRMIDQISSIENSTIVMFLIYFEKDKQRIIDRLLANARQIYNSLPPARLEDDASEFWKTTMKIDLPLGLPQHIEKNRHEARVLKDAHEERKLLDPKTELEATKLTPYAYDESLPEGLKLHLVNQSMMALGQVIRNFSANLSGPRKVEILKETYLLALRAVARIMAVCRTAMESFDRIDDLREKGLSVIEAKRIVEQFFTVIPQIFALTMCHSVSGCVGIADMDKAYIETARQLNETIAIRLIDLTVKLNHFANFPEMQIRDLADDTKGNPFSEQILHFLVAGYLLFNKVDDATFDRTVRILDLKLKSLSTEKE